MGKGGIILGLIGLLLGAGGLGFGIINFMNQPTVYYVYRDTEFYPSPISEHIPIPELAIVVDTSGPASIHLLFTCSARCHGQVGTYSDLMFYIMIDGVRQTDMPWARTGSFQSNTNYEYSTVSLQHYFTLTSAGRYNITITILTEWAGNFIRQSSLWVRSYPA